MLPSYQEVIRKPNVMRTRNPLKQTTSKVVSLADRVAELNTYKDWKKLIAEYRRQGIMISPKLRPLVQMVKLGKILIDVDIQRALDRKHCTKKIAAVNVFDPRLIQVMYCIKTPKKDEYHAVDGQHTATTLAALIDAGLFEGETDWREVEVAVLYIETLSKAFARKAFALINGKGKKKISAWYDHRTKVLSVRIDGSADEDDVIAERKQKICEKYDCYPVDEESSHANTTAGTFTHMQAFNLPDDILKIACKFHNDYFHYDVIDGSLWFMIDDIVKGFNAAGIKLTPEFLEELAGILQNCFAGLAEFHAAVHRAHQRWGEHYYGYKKFPWSDDAIASVLVLLYEKLGGRQRVPAHMKDRFEKILDFIDDDIKDLYQTEA
jgi:hypothetical protein